MTPCCVHRSVSCSAITREVPSCGDGNLYRDPHLDNLQRVREHLVLNRMCLSNTSLQLTELCGRRGGKVARASGHGRQENPGTKGPLHTWQPTQGQQRYKPEGVPLLRGDVNTRPLPNPEAISSWQLLTKKKIFFFQCNLTGHTNHM